MRALLVSTALAVAALVAWIEGGPTRYEGFKNPLASFAISALIGLTAGLSFADDTGRRYLIGGLRSSRCGLGLLCAGSAQS